MFFFKMLCTFVIGVGSIIEYVHQLSGEERGGEGGNRACQGERKTHQRIGGDDRVDACLRGGDEEGCHCAL